MCQNRTRLFITLFLLSSFTLLGACVGGPSGQTTSSDEGQRAAASTTVPGVEKIDLASVEDMQVGEVLKTGYDNIIIRDFGSSSQIQEDYPDAVNSCKAAILKQLQEKSVYKAVAESGKSLSGKSAVVDLKVIDMRIASGSARFWGGAFVGSSFMEVLVEVRNEDNGEIVHQKLLATSNSAWAASYTGGSSDQSLPSDFGILVGEYLFNVIPVK